MAQPTQAKAITIKDGDITASLKEFVQSVLESDGIDAVLAPRHLPLAGAGAKPAVMPTLISDPEALSGVDLLAPAFPLNTAKMVSRLTRKPLGRTVAVFLRPCEIRAFVELVKLRQGRTEEVVIIGTDCPGAVRNTDFPQMYDGDGPAATDRFIEAMMNATPNHHGHQENHKNHSSDNIPLMTACQACEHPVPDGADIAIGLWGMDIRNKALALAQTPAGEALLDRLGLPDADIPKDRAAAVEKIVAERTAHRDEMFAETEAVISDLSKLTDYLAGCVNCYNCRVACPVCYCRECVFVTDAFNHEPAQYLQWAHRKGAIKMPTDTTFYHITRLAHMSTACVGCGQCSNACPNDIPVMELFRTVARKTQAAFDYEAGRDLDAPPPLTEFRENEFTDVVGIEQKRKGVA